MRIQTPFSENTSVKRTPLCKLRKIAEYAVLYTFGVCPSQFYGTQRQILWNAVAIFVERSGNFCGTHRQFLWNVVWQELYGTADDTFCLDSGVHMAFPPRVEGLCVHRYVYRHATTGRLFSAWVLHGAPIRTSDVLPGDRLQRQRAGMKFFGDWISAQAATGNVVSIAVDTAPDTGRVLLVDVAAVAASMQSTVGCGPRGVEHARRSRGGDGPPVGRRGRPYRHKLQRLAGQRHDREALGCGGGTERLQQGCAVWQCHRAGQRLYVESWVVTRGAPVEPMSAVRRHFSSTALFCVADSLICQEARARHARTHWRLHISCLRPLRTADSARLLCRAACVHAFSELASRFSLPLSFFAFPPPPPVRHIVAADNKDVSLDYSLRAPRRALSASCLLARADLHRRRADVTGGAAAGELGVGVV